VQNPSYLVLRRSKLVSDCLFCRVIAKQIPAKVDYEDEQMIVIHDINPQAPIHLLLIPKKHIARIHDLAEPDLPLISRLIGKAKEIAERCQVGEKGYRLVFNSGLDGGQSVFHIHLHLLAGRHMSWPPG
jgi:histidine triad (HIT) family protein